MSSNPELAHAALEDAEAVICRIVRRKLGATLRHDDGREQNLDAMDVLGEIRLKLVRKRAMGEAAAITDWPSYAAMVAYNACADYLRAKYPRRTSLKNALCRLVEKSGDCGVWQLTSGETVCGRTSHRNMSPYSTRIDQLCNDPWKLPPDVLVSQSFDSIAPSALNKIVQAALDYARSPIPIDDLVLIIGQILGLEEMTELTCSTDAETGQSLLDNVPSPQKGPDSAWFARERLRLLWSAILQLLPWHRAAYLLNLRDGGIEAFPYYGVASVEEIGKALDLTDKQFSILAAEVGLNPDLRSQSSILRGSGQKFVLYWKYLPLDDNTIAKVLSVDRGQIIGYRNKAVERLRRNLSGLI
jgi:hypothetical protein